MRREPYTERGIGRVSCCRCGEPSIVQWQCCATGNKWMALCVECDIGLNKVALDYVGHLEADKLLRNYAASKRVLYNPDNSKKAKVARGESLTMRRKR